MRRRWKRWPFSGTIIFVPDRWFLSQLATKFWVSEENTRGITPPWEEPGDWQRAIELSFEEPELTRPSHP